MKTIIMIIIALCLSVFLGCSDTVTGSGNGNTTLKGDTVITPIYDTIFLRWDSTYSKDGVLTVKKIDSIFIVDRTVIIKGKGSQLDTLLSYYEDTCEIYVSDVSIDLEIYNNSKSYPKDTVHFNCFISNIDTNIDITNEYLIDNYWLKFPIIIRAIDTIYSGVLDSNNNIFRVNTTYISKGNLDIYCSINLLPNINTTWYNHDNHYTELLARIPIDSTYIDKELKDIDSTWFVSEYGMIKKDHNKTTYLIINQKVVATRSFYILPK